MIWSTLKDWEIYCCVFGVMSWFIYAQQPMSEVNGNVYTRGGQFQARLIRPVHANWKIRSCGPILLSIWCVLCIPAAIKTNWILIRQVVIPHQRLVVFGSDEKEAAFQSSVTYRHKKWQVVNCEAELGHWWSPLQWIKVPSVHVIVKLEWLGLVAVSWKLLRSCLMCKWLMAFVINGLGESLLQPLIWSKLQHARFPN